VAKPKRNRLREERIHNEVIVDAYGPEEQALGWYYYLDNKISFPLSARCIAAKMVSPLRKGETVEALRLAPEDACAGDMLVLIDHRGHRRLALLASPGLLFLSQAAPLGVTHVGGIEDAYGQTSVEIATHLGRSQSQACRF